MTQADSLKTGLGLNLQPVTLTPVPVPATMPVLGLIASTVGQSRINFHDSALSGKVKPYGAKQVDLHIGYGVAAIVDPAECAYHGSVNKSPAIITWPSENRGQIATVFARYRTQSGPGGAAQFGPWSEAMVLTVT